MTLRLWFCGALTSHRTSGEDLLASILGSGSRSLPPSGAELLWGFAWWRGPPSPTGKPRTPVPEAWAVGGGQGRPCEAGSEPGPRLSRTPGPGDQSRAERTMQGLKTDSATESRRQSRGAWKQQEGRQGSDCVLGRRTGGRPSDMKALAQRQPQPVPERASIPCPEPAGTGRW